MKCTALLTLILIVSAHLSFSQNIELVNSGEVIKRGIALYDSGQYKHSITEFSKVNRSDTNYVWSLYQKALSCEADSQYNQAVKYCKEGLTLNEQPEYRPEFYNTYGNTLNDMGKPDEAIHVFDEAIAKYPSYSLFYYNRGTVLMGMKKYAEAEPWFKKTLLINPYMYSAHFQLGVAAIQQGKMIPSFLSFTGYLLVDNDGKYWQNCINILSQMTKGTDEMLKFKSKRTADQSENYQNVEDIVFSKIALDKAYKPIISLDDPISRQIQVVFEKLEYSDADNDFWIQYYLPYFKKVYKDGKFEPFINHIFANAKVQVIQDYNKKNKKEMEAFTNEAATYFNDVRETRELMFAKRASVNERYAFDGGKLVGKGMVLNNGKILAGKWALYFSAGNRRGSGLYTESGERDGVWEYYRMLGQLKARETYKNGKQDGPQDYYYENGNLSSHENDVNGLAEGIATTYSYSGSVKSTVNYKLGKKDGEERTYYANGNLHAINNYVNGVLTGRAREYYRSGGIKEDDRYVNGKIDGPYKLYHEDGSLSDEGVFANDKAEGEWKYYYNSGKLKEKRNYVNDKQEGPQQEYYENGQLSSTSVTKKGKVVGDAVYYAEDGKMTSKYYYENDIIKSVKYFDKSGKQLSSSTNKGDMLDVTTYTAGGDKKSHVFYNKKGDLEGPDTVFYPSGKIYQINQYKDGQFNGNSLSFYLNGKKKAEINMVDGKEDGYYKSFKVNGQPEAEGWIKAGDDQGEWRYYNEMGKLYAKSYYLDNDLHGYKKEYDNSGRKTIETKYYRGWIEKLTQYDSTGQVIQVDSFPKTTGKYTLVFPNGKTMIQADYIKGDFDGAYKTFYFDGSPESLTYYKKGLQDSTYVSYFYGGTKYSEGRYLRGGKTGLWKFYDEDGKLSTSEQYVNDEVNGEKNLYYPNGTKNFESLYKDGEINGVHKKYDPDGSLAYQTIFENGLVKSYSYLDKDGKLVPQIPIASVNGKMKSYFQNGKVSREGDYSDGVKNGHDKVYYTNGQLRSDDVLVYDVSEGEGKEYYADGKLKSQYAYVSDNLNGVYKEFDKNGMLKKETTYLNGSYQGPTKYYENGKLVKTMDYSEGKLIAVRNEK